MPIYEYYCADCDHMTSRLIMNTEDADTAVCRRCASPRAQRVMSRFAYHRSEESRLAELDAGESQGPGFYQDSRNVGLWAKKRAQDLGVDLGSQFEETVEKARTGKILDDV
jgi:putative FmdB family regulatory protein